MATILGDPQLYEHWKVELKGMADRIITMREKLHQALVDQGAPGDWSFILKQIGMFSFTGLTKVRPLHCQLLTVLRACRAGYS